MRLVALAALVASAASYAPATMRVQRTAAASDRSAAVSMISANPGIVAKKQQIIDEVKETLEDTMLMFCVRSEGIPVNKINEVRQKLPEGATMRCVKNTLVKLAIEDDERFPVADDLLVKSNYWFFVGEQDVRATVKVWDDFISENKALEDNAILGGMFEGEILDAKGIEAVTKLPTKQELMGQTAMLLKALPTKLARSVKGADAGRIAKAIKEAQGQKLARAVDAMKEKL